MISKHLLEMVEQIAESVLIRHWLGLFHLTYYFETSRFSYISARSWSSYSGSMTQVLKSPFLSNDDFKSACNALLQYIAAAAEKDYWATAAVEHENVCRERCRGLDIANIRKEEAMIVFTRRLRKSFSEVEEPVDSSDLIADICDEDDVEVIQIMLAICMTC